MKSFLETVRERVVIYDGAMGTQIQEREPSPEDFWGKEGCNEILVLSRPDIIKDIHATYYKAGADVVETNTFGASSIVLGEYDLQAKVHEINKRAAELAREVAGDFSTPQYGDFAVLRVNEMKDVPDVAYAGIFDESWNLP